MKARPRLHMRTLPHIRLEQNKELKDSFALFDRNGDGKITLEELGEAMKAIGQDLSSADLKATMNKVDSDGDGQIDYNEFVIMMTTAEESEDHSKDTPKDKADLTELRKYFKTFDKDGDGFIVREELAQVMNKLGDHLKDHELDEMFAEADENKDGKIEFEEFTKMVSRF
ncbi:hypothetical protein IWQ60_009151 [Tieghemiomyces parasiticus]|uniref:EF-hand domain-containing protein n=1 Tax=Tieghemiomyces parasiticus TaxID=78921 RepID=A0A9W7ZXA6_9FUNG|nr:hypothetical protein IWQ60_009151 [Tieghemiomyces parasiticus]